MSYKIMNEYLDNHNILLMLNTLCHSKSLQTNLNVYSNDINDNNAIDQINYDDYNFTMHVINLPVLLTVPTLYLKTMGLCCLMYNSILFNMNKLICFQYLITILNVNINIHSLINLYAKMSIDLYFPNFKSHFDHAHVLILNAITCTY